MKPAELNLQLLDALSELTKLRPEWRLGQTVANMAVTAGRMDAGGVWDLEDEEALLAAKTLIAQYSRIDSNTAGTVGDGQTESAPNTSFAADHGR
jgi:hypothetical protein